MKGRDGHVECRPRLYVHDLPDSYRLPACASSPPEPLAGSPHDLFATDQYALGSIIHERANNFACRTRDANTADMFLIPAFRSLLGPEMHAESAGNVSAARARFVDRLSPWLTRKGGRDHLLVQSRTGAWYEQRPFAEVHDFDPALGSALRVALENNRQERPRGSGEYLSIPWPSIVRLDQRAGIGDTSRPWPWRSTHERPLLASMIFDLYHARNTMPLRARHLRQALWENCVRHLRYQRPVAASLSAFPLPVRVLCRNARAITNATRNAHAITSPHPGALCQTLTMS